MAKTPHRFTEQDDTPASYTGHAGKLVQVNSTPNALEFVDGASNLVSATTTIDVGSSAAPADGDILKATSSTAATWVAEYREYTHFGQLQDSPSTDDGYWYTVSTGFGPEYHVVNGALGTNSGTIGDVMDALPEHPTWNYFWPDVTGEIVSLRTKAWLFTGTSTAEFVFVRRDWTSATASTDNLLVSTIQSPGSMSSGTIYTIDPTIDGTATIDGDNIFGMCMRRSSGSETVRINVSWMVKLT